MDLVVALMRKAQTIEIVNRTAAKAKRGAELRPWAMGVGRRLVDPGSSLAHDDDGFIADLYAGNMVSRTAVYPIMNAIDSITSIAELIAGRTESGDSHAASLLTLSRMATESAATTIWLLSSTDRNMRRGLSVRFTASELNAQKGYHSSTRKWFEHGPLGKQSVEYQQFVEHVRLFDQRVVMLDSGKQQTPNAKVKGSADVVIAAAKWLDGHPPLHDGDAGPYGRPFGFEDVAKSHYNVSSAIVHGLKWPLDYMPNGEVELSRMIVEGVNNAVSMAECAVALFEAQAQNHTTNTDRPILYPDRLQPSIDAWADLYPSTGMGSG
jgi:hypothetical protein